MLHRKIAAGGVACSRSVTKAVRGQGKGRPVIASMSRHDGRGFCSNVLIWLFVLTMMLPFLASAQESKVRELEKKAADLIQRGHYSEAAVVANEELRVAQATYGLEHLNVAGILNNLGVIYRNQGEFGKAVSLLKRSLSIYEKVLGVEHPFVATALVNLAATNVAQGQRSDAEALLTRALTIMEKAYGPESPKLIVELDSLAELSKDDGRYEQAEALYRRVEAISEKSAQTDLVSLAKSMSHHASMYETLGDYMQAESLFKRALAIREKQLGAEHPEVANGLVDLATMYTKRERYSEAESLYKRALAVQEHIRGIDSLDVASTLNRLAEMYEFQGKQPLAEPLYQRSLAIREKILSPVHPDLAGSLSGIATMYVRQGQYMQAEPILKRVLAIEEKYFGPAHPNVATALYNLASMYSAKHEYVEAETFYRRALSIREKALGQDNPNVAQTMSDLGLNYEEQEQYGPALEMFRRATTIYRQRIISAATLTSSEHVTVSERLQLRRHLILLSINPDKSPGPKVIDEALQLVQLSQTSSTSSAVAKMAARFASGDDALAQLAKRKQDALERSSKAERELVKALSQLPATRNHEVEQRLRDTSAESAIEIGLVDGELARRFPAYKELVRAEPVPLEKIARLLRQGEAMLVYAAGTPTYAFVITSSRASWRALKLDIKNVTAQIAQVRSEMEFDNQGQPSKVSVDVLHELYKVLFAPIVPELTGVSHVMLVLSGPLQSLPFGMMISAPPPDIRAAADYRKVAWLIKDYAFSVLPSVGSIQAFRQFTKTERAQQPFAGFGDPQIGNGARLARSARAVVDTQLVFRGGKPHIPAQMTGAASEDIADVDFIRRAPRLPETADELRRIAATLKAGPQSVWLQGDATETRVKAMDLSKYRIIAFATHGAVAGEMKGAGEPGLVLTPPAVGTVADDGYLSMSEIAKLNLNADWVVLSACNTAAADGTPGAEGLSGLAKAFFYAGARSLLVSHWRVASEATVPLTTAMLAQFDAHPQLGKASAQQKAILALIDTPNHPEYSHPIFWAPFVVVGEGGGDISGK